MNPNPQCTRPRIVAFIPAFSLALILLPSVELARGEVRMTEVDINDGTQRAELFNSGPDSVNLNGWSLRTLSGGNLGLNGSILVNQHRVFTLPAAFVFIRTRGDCLELFDASLASLVDRVIFGDTGGAPLDIQATPGSSLARTGGGADPTGIGSATAWSVDFTSTFGSPNNAPPGNFAPSIRINEIIPQGAIIRAELYNTTLNPVNLANYRLTTGQSSLLLSGTIPAHGFAVFDISPITFTFSLNLYLFRNDEVRIDQLGLSDAPGNQFTWNDVIGQGQSLGRFPDGAGPGIGFDLDSSGFPNTLRRMPPTPGANNQGDSGGGGRVVPVSIPALTVGALVLIVLAGRNESFRRRGRSRLAGPGASE